MHVVADIDVVLQFRFVGSKEMVSHSSLSREGCNCSKCGDGWEVGSSGKEVAENQAMGSGDENPGERWYNLDNSSTERRSLFHLERELNASLRLEQGGGQSASLLWLMRILLGHLFKEWLVLGRAIKMFSKF